MCNKNHHNVLIKGDKNNSKTENKHTLWQPQLSHSRVRILNMCRCCV